MYNAVGISVYGQYLRRIAFQLRKMQDDMLAPHNITSQQARLLGKIALYGPKKSCCQKDLEQSMGLCGSSITSLVKGLEGHDYLLRHPGGDARTKQLEVTEKGTRLLDTFLQVFSRTEQELVEGMTPTERTVLLDLLKRAAENLERRGAPPAAMETREEGVVGMIE